MTAVGAKTLPVDRPRRLPIFRLAMVGLGLVVLAAVSGNITPVLGIVAACVAAIAMMVNWGLWILDNTAQF
jgi:hypothetical protein